MENKKYRILIIDDSPLIIMELTKILSPEYDVFTESNAMNAIKAVNTYKPDIILLDIIMPEQDGYTTLASLKNKAKTKNIPVILITGLTKTDNEEKGLSWGAADYITKPFSPDIIKLRIRNQILILEQLKEIETANETNLAKTEFLNNMISEIRISIDNIASLSEMAQNENDFEKVKNYFGMISKSTNILLMITENINSYIKDS